MFWIAVFHFFSFVRSFVCNNDAMQSTHCGLIQRNEDESAFQMNKPLTEIPATKNQTNSKCHSKAWDEDGNTTLHSQTLCESSETVYWLESHFGNDKDIGIERQQQQCHEKKTQKRRGKKRCPTKRYENRFGFCHFDSLSWNVFIYMIIEMKWIEMKWFLACIAISLNKYIWHDDDDNISCIVEH